MPQPATTSPPDRASAISPNGAAWAAILAAAVACLAFGVVIDLAERFKSFSSALNLYKPAGDLSGKSSLALLIWLSSWAILHARWKNRAMQSPRKLTIAAVALIVLGLLASFPPLFNLFAAR